MLDIEKEVNNYLRNKNETERNKHVSSGYLSASRLDKSTLENVLYLIGVPPLELTDYSLKVFARGNQVEDWVVGLFEELELVERSQTELEYVTPKGHKIVGIEDVKFKGEDFPTEVKSIKNSAFKYLDIEGAKLGHILQACTYALAEGKEKARVLYIAADDFRTKSFIVKVEDYKELIDSLAEKTYNAIRDGKLPEFKPITDFQKLELYKEYTSYPEWLGQYHEGTIPSKTVRKGVVREGTRKASILVRPHNEEWLMDKLKNEYPDAYKKLKGQ